MFRSLLLIIVFTCGVNLLAQDENILLSTDQNFPKWLKTNHSRTDQTSGIAFIKSECGKKYFLTADDIGFINLLTLESDTIFDIENVSFIDSAENYFSNFPKKDFEEITYDKGSGEVYLSVEGNGDNYNDYVGIYKLIFNDNDVLSKQITSVIKMSYTPASLFYKYTNWNIGYEGFALDDNYFYLGLEGFYSNNQFADSTFIFIANKSDLSIFKEISTKSLGISTVCGLYSDEDYSLWGIDRNNRTIFHIFFDDEFNIKDFSKYKGVTFIPGYHNLNYLPSYESITMGEQNNIYIVDDPWKEVYVPKQEILNKLDNETINNFKTYVPTIFKFKVTYP